MKNLWLVLGLLLVGSLHGTDWDSTVAPLPEELTSEPLSDPDEWKMVEDLVGPWGEVGAAGDVRPEKRKLNVVNRPIAQRRRFQSSVAAFARMCQWGGCTERQIFPTDQEFYDHVEGHLAEQK
jgi:hypothetical protein